MDKMTLRAELARRGLLAGQLRPWWSPDTDSMRDPKAEEIAEAWSFIAWVDEQTVDWRES